MKPLCCGWELVADRPGLVYERPKTDSIVQRGNYNLHDELTHLLAFPGENDLGWFAMELTFRWFMYGAIYRRSFTCRNLHLGMNILYFVQVQHASAQSAMRLGRPISIPEDCRIEARFFSSNLWDRRT